MAYILSKKQQFQAFPIGSTVGKDYEINGVLAASKSVTH